MKFRRYTEEQLIAFLHKVEAGVQVADLGRNQGDGDGVAMTVLCTLTSAPT